MSKKLNFISILSLFALIGCGDNVENERRSVASLHEITMPNAQNITIPRASKLQRANWDGIAPLTDGFFITDDSTLLSFKIEDNRVGTDEIRSEVVFIDADNNPNTGYIGNNGGGIGAEYLIEGNNIFTYGGTGWNWNILSRIDRNIVANEIEVEFDINLIQHSPTIRALSGLVDTNWAIIGRSDIVNYTLSNDDDNDDNNDQNQNNTTFTITDDIQNLQLQITNPLIASEDIRTEAIFIDADNNPNTGYTNPAWRSIGAEYLVQGNNIFTYGGTGWDWNILSRIDRNRDADQINISINRDILQLNTNIRAIAGLLDRNWQTTFMYDITTHNITTNDNDNNDNNDNNNDNNNDDNHDRFNITDNSLVINFNLQSTNIADSSARNSVIFIDADNNPNTGYNNQGLWHATLGAEFLISNNALYRYGQNGWDWQFLSNIQRVINNDQLNISVDTNLLENLSATFRTTAYLADASWSVRERFDTISHSNEAPVDHGTLSITHNINTFDITIQNDDIRGNTNSEVYIDADNDRNSGFRVNGIGAEYRVINNQLTRYRNDTQEWVSPTNVQRFIDADRIIISIFRSSIRSRRNIALTANLLDENNQIIHTLAPINYEVRGDDDEITLSLDEPNLYIFTIHSPLIGDGGFSAAHGGEVRSLHVAIDSDMNRFTGNIMNNLGADHFIGSWEVFGRFIGLDNGNSWNDRWEWFDREQIHTTVGNHTVEIRIPRAFLTSENGIINVGSTFNNDDGHFYWTNHYEFNLNSN